MCRHPVQSSVDERYSYWCVCTVILISVAEELKKMVLFVCNIVSNSKFTASLWLTEYSFGEELPQKDSIGHEANTIA